MSEIPVIGPTWYAQKDNEHNQNSQVLIKKKELLMKCQNITLDRGRGVWAQFFDSKTGR